MRFSRTPARLTLTVASAAAVLLTLAGCSPATDRTPSSNSSSSDSTSTISIVASTDVWGDIAAHIGGDRVRVTSIIDDPDKDPHEYEADARNQLALSQAAVIVENGGGYDDFVDTMLSGASNSDAVVLNAATISGYDLEPAAGQFNEHLWYDFPTVEKVVDQIASTLSTIDAPDSSMFTANATAYKAQIASLVGTEAHLKATYDGEGAAITEPVPLYLLNASGLVDKTPEKFSEAIENGTDVAPDVLAETVALLSSGQVKVLAYNSQTAGPQTEAVLAAAKAGNVPVMPVTETLPTNSSYIEWMTANLQALQAALSQ